MSLLASGNIVTVTDRNSVFANDQGIVIDTKSSLDKESGPIAVFFDKEVESYGFNQISAESPRWTETVPTLENYRQNPRVICFRSSQLRIDKGWDIKNLANRFFGRYGWHHASSLSFHLVPNTHACHLAACSSGLLATQRTIVNYCGSIYDIYSCETCHRLYHKISTESFPELKNPLPRKRKSA